VGIGPIARGKFITPPSGPSPATINPHTTINARPQEPRREKLTVVTRCGEAIGHVCLRTDIVRVCLGSDCYDLRPPASPSCMRCWLGGSAVAGLALGAIGALFLVGRR